MTLVQRFPNLTNHLQQRHVPFNHYILFVINPETELLDLFTNLIFRKKLPPYNTFLKNNKNTIYLIKKT